jgi:glyoxylase-like metal-dependent hydrolase (beta-lactamase superfamily II)
MVKVFYFDESQKEFSANTYVLGKVGGNCVVIDLGSTDPKIYEYIKSHYESCSAILLTHGHFDHIRGISKFLKQFKDQNIPIYLNEKDKELLKDPRINAAFLNNENTKVDIDIIPVKDGDILNIKNFDVEVIETPFHTQGSVCYLFSDENALFTGDTLFKGAIGRTDLPTSTPEDIPASLNKIKNLRQTLVIYPGHGPITRLIDEQNNNPFMKGI